MYGRLLLLNKKGAPEKAERIFISNTPGYNEAWLRDTLFSNPDILPINEIDPAFGPLIPLCKELRTPAGNVDAVFINDRGRLTIVECKLWRNPQARREVVAQTLDYVSAISKWTYADLQRQVSAAVGKKENVPFIVAKHIQRDLKEAEFIDAVSRSLREGRFLILLAGDGIREGVQSLTELVNRNASKAFEVGLIEVAMYKFTGGRVAVQPRVVAATETITRHVTLIRSDNIVNPTMEEQAEPSEPRAIKGSKDHLKKFWEPLLRMKFDDPEQDPPIWIPATNNLSLAMPFQGIRLKAYARVDKPKMGVFLTGTKDESLDAIGVYLKRERQSLLEELPQGTRIIAAQSEVHIDTEHVKSDDQRRAWLRDTLNAYVNVLRPRMKEWFEDTLQRQ